MNAEQQKGASHHGDGGTGGTRTPSHGSQQTFTAWEPQRALTTNLMEQVCDPKNLIRAYRRVRANKGKPGVDGMTVHELADWLRKNQVALTASLLDGSYQPQPVGVPAPLWPDIRRGGQQPHRFLFVESEISSSAFFRPHLAMGTLA